MKKILSSILVLFFYRDSYSEAMFAGNITTINPRSEVNALRNPAMLSRQKKDNFSVIYVYSYLINSDIESDVNVSGMEVNSKYNLDESYNGAILFSGVWASGKSAYGLGISKTGDGQVKLSSSDFILASDKITEDKKFLGSSLLLSYSYRITGKQSLGVQIETIFSNEYIDKDMSAENKEIESSTTKTSTGATIGYYIHDNHFSFGAMLKPGMFGTEKREYDVTNKTTTTEDHKTISSHYAHHEGTSIIIGFGIRPSNKFMFAFEGGGIIPFTKEEKKYSDSLVKQTQKNELLYAAITRTGIDYSLNPYITIGLGCGYTHYSADFHTTDDNTNGSFDFSIIQVIGGIKIKPSRNYNLLFGLDYNRLIQNMKMEETGVSIELDLVQDSLNYTAGISCYY